MSEMVVPWLYEIESISGEQFLHYFQCLEAIKLELYYQVYLEAMKKRP